MPVEAENLSKWYGDVIGLNDVTFRLEPGVTGLLGPNGAGKSTLVRLCMGLLKPNQGRIRVLGEDPWSNPELTTRVGYLPEGEPPWQDQDAHEALTFHARLGGLQRKDARQEADRVLETVGLRDQAERPVEDLSLGMRQRLKFALALLHDPDLLILDEPLKGTDPATRPELMDLVRRLPDRGKSALVSTHVLEDLEAMTDRMLLLHGGRLFAHGTVSEIRDLIDEVPRKILVGTPDTDEVGQALWQLDSVVGLERTATGVVASTGDPQAFHRALQDVALDEELPVDSIRPLDEDIESVFSYLVGSGAGPSRQGAAPKTPSGTRTQAPIAEGGDAE